jgi:hypothetical protein
VERDGYSHEIELVMAREGPARIAKTLLQMLNALQAIGLGEADSWGLVTKLALDCIPPIRLAAIRDILETGETSAADLAARLGLPTQTARRALEDLAAHKVLARTKQGSRDLWAASKWLIDHWEPIPQMSVGLFRDSLSNSPYTPTDFSGTDPAAKSTRSGPSQFERPTAGEATEAGLWESLEQEALGGWTSEAEETAEEPPATLGGNGQLNPDGTKTAPARPRMAPRSELHWPDLNVTTGESHPAEATAGNGLSPADPAWPDAIPWEALLGWPDS